jgi:hypothetical protein
MSAPAPQIICDGENSAACMTKDNASLAHPAETPEEPQNAVAAPYPKEGTFPQANKEEVSGYQYKDFGDFTYKTFDNASNLVNTFNPFRDPNGKSNLADKTGLDAAIEGSVNTLGMVDTTATLAAPGVKLPIDALRAVGASVAEDVIDGIKGTSQNGFASNTIDLAKNTATNLVMFPKDLVVNSYKFTAGLVTGFGDGLKYVGEGISNMFTPNEKSGPQGMQQTELSEDSLPMPHRPPSAPAPNIGPAPAPEA